MNSSYYSSLENLELCGGLYNVLVTLGNFFLLDSLDPNVSNCRSFRSRTKESLESLKFRKKSSKYFSMRNLNLSQEAHRMYWKKIITFSNKDFSEIISLHNPNFIERLVRFFNFFYIISFSIRYTYDFYNHQKEEGFSVSC